MKTHVVPLALCPRCGIELDRASAVGEAEPVPGDISVCIKCAAPLTFDDNMRPRMLTFEEFSKFSIEEQYKLLEAIGVVEAIRRLDR